MQYVRTMSSHGHLTIVFSKAPRAVAAPRRSVRKRPARKLGILRQLPVAAGDSRPVKGGARGRS